MKLGLNDIQPIYKEGYLQEFLKIAEFHHTFLGLNEVKIKLSRVQNVSELSFGPNEHFMSIHGI